MLEIVDVDKTKEIIDNSVIDYLSVHLYSKNKEQTEEETYEIVKQNISELKRKLGKEIILENSPYRNRYSHCEYLFNPDVISKIVRENNVGFLFDISHARKSAEHFGMTLEEYVSKLPMERLVEIHLAGMYYIPNPETDNVSMYSERQIDFIKQLREMYGSTYDNHGKLNEEDYEFLKEAVKKYNTLRNVTLEYGSCHLKFDFEDNEYTYPVCSFDRINPIAKKEVLEQLMRIKDIIS